MESKHTKHRSGEKDEKATIYLWPRSEKWSAIKHKEITTAIKDKSKKLKILQEREDQSVIGEIK